MLWLMMLYLVAVGCLCSRYTLLYLPETRQDYSIYQIIVVVADGSTVLDYLIIYFRISGVIQALRHHNLISLERNMMIVILIFMALVAIIFYIFATVIIAVAKIVIPITMIILIKKHPHTIFKNI